MKSLIGLLLIILGVCLGLYVGVYVCFIGGIIDVIKEVRAPELSAANVAWGIAKVVFASLAGWLSAIVFIFPGAALMKD